MTSPFKRIAKKRSTLAPPPQLSKTFGNLDHPEAATLIDGRTARATGMTMPLNTRVQPHTHKTLKLAAARDTKKMCEVLTEAIFLYEEKHAHR